MNPLTVTDPLHRFALPWSNRFGLTLPAKSSRPRGSNGVWQAHNLPEVESRRTRSLTRSLCRWGYEGAMRPEPRFLVENGSPGMPPVYPVCLIAAVLMGRGVLALDHFQCQRQSEMRMRGCMWGTRLTSVLLRQARRAGLSSWGTVCTLRGSVDEGAPIALYGCLTCSLNLNCCRSLALAGPLGIYLTHSHPNPVPCMCGAHA